MCRADRPHRRAPTNRLLPATCYNTDSQPQNRCFVPKIRTLTSTDDMSDKIENLNLADLDLNKLNLSEEDALALSYLTPGLSRRIQKQLLSQLTPAEVRKLKRTLSSRTPDENAQKEPKFVRRSVDRISSTLPRRFSVETDTHKLPRDEFDEGRDALKGSKSFLPVKFGNNREDYRPSYDFNVRSSSIGAEPRAENKFSYRRPSRINKSLVRDPGTYSASKSDIQSPESSISESTSRNEESSSYRKDTDSVSSRYSDSSVSRPYSKYDTFSKYTPSGSTQSLAPTLDTLKTDSKIPSTRRISRFLRPDFYDPPKENNVYMKEKKEREMETQKVLKEIRDKRKGRLNLKREKSASREPIDDKETREVIKKDNLNANNVNGNRTSEEKKKDVHHYVNITPQPSEPSTNTSKPNNESAKVLHDYVNVKVAETSPTVKKERISKLTRPKSYPTETLLLKEKLDDRVEKASDVVKKDDIEKTKAIHKEKQKILPEKESKISRLRKGFTKQSSKDKTKDDKNEANRNVSEEEKSHKNKLLQSIEKKLEKFRTNNASSSKDPQELKELKEKKSAVENTIRRLREQSLPRNIEHCTESGLIKRAVSVEDLTGAKPLQASKKSVTKILGLFKKYEEQDSKKKSQKKSKSKDKDSNASTSNESDKPIETVMKENKPELENVDCSKTDLSESSQLVHLEKKERPRSLLLDKMKHFQTTYNGAKSDSLLNGTEKELRTKSKLPVNSFRRSLNLDNLPEPPKFYKSPDSSEARPDRKNLKLDFSRLSKNINPPEIRTTPSTSNEEEANSRENRYSAATTDDSSTVLSPCDDYLSCDSWSACSDFHHINDLPSPLSHNGHVYSGDESESVIDRIRRKSFYTRFNEKKRPVCRKPTVSHNYKDIDSYKPPDYSSLDRKSYDLRSPRKSSYSAIGAEPKREYRPYTRSTSVLNDYVNMPGSYQTYSSRIGRPSRCLYSDSEDNALDDLLTAKSRKHSPYTQPSSISRASVSPVNEHRYDRASSTLSSPTFNPL